VKLQRALASAAVAFTSVISVVPSSAAEIKMSKRVDKQVVVVEGQRYWPSDNNCWCGYPGQRATLSRNRDFCHATGGWCFGGWWVGRL